MSAVHTWEQEELEARQLIRERPSFAATVAALQAPARKPRKALGGMTKRQQEALAFIRAYLAKNEGVSPSFDEIMAALGLGSKAGVFRIVSGLQRRGFIDRTYGAARSIVLVAP